MAATTDNQAMMQKLSKIEELLQKLVNSLHPEQISSEDVLSVVGENHQTSTGDTETDAESELKTITTDDEKFISDYEKKYSCEYPISLRVCGYSLSNEDKYRNSALDMCVLRYSTDKVVYRLLTLYKVWKQNEENKVYNSSSFVENLTKDMFYVKTKYML